MKKILIVDDESGLREVLEKFLRRHYEVFSAADGEAGMAQLRRQKPDLVLLDITMPKMDGWQVLKQMRGDDATRDLPVIMLTANADTQSILESQRLRVSDYFVKPVVLEELSQYIERYA